DGGMGGGGGGGGGTKRRGRPVGGRGPASGDRGGRRGLRVGDLLRPADLPARLFEARRHYEHLCRGAGRPTEVDWDRLVADLTGFGHRLGSRIVDTSLVLHPAMPRPSPALSHAPQPTPPAP